MHDSRISQMENWLVKKKLNEAYNITQLRDVNRQDAIEKEARDQIMHNNNVKNYKMWMTQQNNQERYLQMERARMMQMKAEQQQSEDAQMGIQSQINALNQKDIFNQQRQYEMEGYGEEMEMEMGEEEAEMDMQEEMEDLKYNPLRQK